MSARERLKILLLQARQPGDPAREHEHLCFAARAGLPPEQVVAHDLCARIPTLAEVQGCDALMVGGSGDYYISRRDLPGFDQLLQLLCEVIAAEHPMFLSCYGFGALVAALGGDMVHDPDNAEVGSYDLSLTPAGQADELFGAIPIRFVAQLGHKDRATGVPPGTVNLASSDLCPVQALRVPGAPIWATQFHPELDRASNLERLRIYMADYGPAGGDDAAVEDGFRDSPETAALIRRFLELVFD